MVTRRIFSRGAGAATALPCVPRPAHRAPRNTPMSNLFLSMLDPLGVEVERHGDSTGRIPKLDG